MSSIQFHLAHLTSELIRCPSVEIPEYEGAMKKIAETVENRIRRLKGCYIHKFTCQGKPGLIVHFKPEQKRPVFFFGWPFGYCAR